MVVAHTGRFSVIEVDGASHNGNGKYADDKSRDQALERAGVYVVRRIDARDVDDPSQLSVFLRDFLEALAR